MARSSGSRWPPSWANLDKNVGRDVIRDSEPFRPNFWEERR
jgi:hypothetical protein